MQIIGNVGLGLAVSMAVALAGCTGNGLSAVENAYLQGSASWDQDKKGSVTCDDWKNYLASLFAAADANRDGVLTKEEFETVIATDRMFESANFAYFDTNKDGKLTLAEMQAVPNPAFRLADRNNDCRLDANELIAARNFSAAKPVIADKGGKGGPGAGPMGK